MALLKVAVLVAVLGALACVDADDTDSRRRLTPRPPPAPTPDPNFQEVSKVPCDRSNNYCGSIDPPLQFKGGGGFTYPG